MQQFAQGTKSKWLKAIASTCRRMAGGSWADCTNWPRNHILVEIIRQVWKKIFPTCTSWTTVDQPSEFLGVWCVKSWFFPSPWFSHLKGHVANPIYSSPWERFPKESRIPSEISRTCSWHVKTKLCCIQTHSTSIMMPILNTLLNFEKIVCSPCCLLHILIQDIH